MRFTDLYLQGEQVALAGWPEVTPHFERGPMAMAASVFEADLGAADPNYKVDAVCSSGSERKYRYCFVRRMAVLGYCC
jgi:hypothetical protein